MGRHKAKECHRGHDLSGPGARYIYIDPHTGKERYQCRQCKLDRHRERKIHGRSAPPPERSFSTAKVDMMLQEAVDLESAPPWVRHPIPWDVDGAGSAKGVSDGQ
jgi:hypothetical protein